MEIWKYCDEGLPYDLTKKLGVISMLSIVIFHILIWGEILPMTFSFYNWFAYLLLKVVYFCSKITYHFKI